MTGNDDEKVFLVQTCGGKGAVKEVGDVQASWLLWHLSPSPESAFVELSLQWGLTFIYFYWLRRIFKAHFPFAS